MSHLDKKDEQIYLRNQLRNVFDVIDACLGCYYAQKTYMYKPLAAQLRILFCDTAKKKNNSLLYLLYPDLQLPSFQAIAWSKNSCAGVKLYQQEASSANIANMPFKLTQYINGLAVADFTFCSHTLSVLQWCEQYVTHDPSTITVKEIIRHIADKDGGAHVDVNPSSQLRLLNKPTLPGRPFGEMFIVALARMAQKIGEQLFGYQGVKVCDELLNQQYIEYHQYIIAHDDRIHFKH